jgi:hypothetical protein
MEKTMDMPAVDAPLVVNDVITKLIEKDLQAWLHLPKEVRLALVSRPSDFRFSKMASDTAGVSAPVISYNGVSFVWSAGAGAWVLRDIV